jgi:phosphoglycerate dehydrogenase-like enzyme
MDQQRSKVWKPRVADKPVTDSVRRRVGILGYGAIGRQIARLAQALGMEVYAYTFRPRDTPESRRHQGYCVSGTGDQEGTIPARWFSGSRNVDIEEFLGQDLDMLVVSLPLNPGTRGLIGRKEFDTLGHQGGKTFVVNIARGPIVDTDALSDALRSGLISGAAVDVTDPEPLPESHPLWTSPNVFITPHISWQSKTVIDRVAGILLDNLERYHKGEPLLNLIQKGHSASSENS